MRGVLSGTSPLNGADRGLQYVADLGRWLGCRQALQGLHNILWVVVPVKPLERVAAVRNGLARITRGARIAFAADHLGLATVALQNVHLRVPQANGCSISPTIISMTCVFCKAPLRGMTDAKIVNVNRARAAACQDLDACGSRVFANERAARGLAPKAAAAK